MSTEPTAAVRPEKIEAWRGFIGRSLVERQRLDIESLRRFVAAVGGDPDAPLDAVPPLGHWAWFLPAVATARIGPDGHATRGDFLPPVRLPRRMFAGGRVRFLAPLALEEACERRSTVIDVRHRVGRSGDLVFVEVERVLAQAGRRCVEETQTLVFRGQGAPLPPVHPSGRPPAAEEGAAVEAWTPGPVDLFRFSAATFNSHRIHYDQAYAREVEGYPDLVVHGIFTAAKLCALAAAHDSRPLAEFSFRAQAPLFVNQTVWLLDRGGAEARALEAVRCDGAVAMTATARFGG